MSCTSSADPGCGSSPRYPAPRRPRPPVPAWHSASPAALLSDQIAEVLNGVHKESPDDRLVGRIHIVEGAMPFRRDQRYRLRHLVPPLLGQVKPDNPAVAWVAAALHV